MNDERDDRPHGGQSGGGRGRSDAEAPSESTGPWSPLWDDEDDAPPAKASGPVRPPTGSSGVIGVRPAPGTPPQGMPAPGPRPGFPPQGMRPPIPPGRVPPGTPPLGMRSPVGAPRPPQRPTPAVDMPTEVIKPYGQDESLHEPELLTHREPLPGDPDYEGPDYEGPDYEDEPLTEDEERRLRRKKTWRRVRRTCYVAAALVFIVPTVAFVITYFIVKVPEPEAAQSQKQVVTLTYADGTTELGKIVPPDGKRTLVQYKDIPEHVKNAVLAAEDNSFWENDGFDLGGIARAVWNNATGGKGGASTITQQYIKVATENDERTLTRKFTELVKAYKMTNQKSKEDILSAYLNTIYFGRGANGIEEASKAYFGKSVKDIDESEAALLAGLIQLPSKWDPAKNMVKADQRWNFVLDIMVKKNWLPAEKRATLTFPPTRPPAEYMTGGGSGPELHIKRRVLEELEPRGFSQSLLAKQGLKIITTIDPKAQELLRQSVGEVMKGQPAELRSAAVSIDPKTGGVIAYYGGENGAGLDYAWDSLQEPGSSFKPFVALAGLENGIGLGQTYDGRSGYQPPGSNKKINNSGMDNSCGQQCSVREAMRRSVNTVFSRMTVDLKPKTVAESAFQAGIPREANGEKLLGDMTVNIAIGGGDTRVRTIDMAGAYATFANDGMRIPPHFVQKVTTGDDKLIRYEASKQQDLQPQLAFDASDSEHNADLARSVTEALVPIAEHSKLTLKDRRPVASKTGTHQYVDSVTENSKAWMVGYTPQVSTAVWIGADQMQAIKGAWGERNGRLHNIFGKDEPGKIWQKFMETYLFGTPVEQFKKPSKPIGKATEDPPNSVPPSTTQQTSQQATTATTTTDAQPTETTTKRPKPTTPTCGIFGCDPTTTTKPGRPTTDTTDQQEQRASRDRNDT